MKKMEMFYEKIKNLPVKFDKISPELLIPMKYEYKGKDIIIEIETQEFTCLCPWNNLPDFALLRIKYIPNKFCVELKSLKYYIQSYRNVYIVHESAVNKIFEDLYKLLKPKWLYVELEFNLRGGIKTVVKRESKRNGRNI
jgi:7-cyano-7-deazaguanine reductase